MLADILSEDSSGKSKESLSTITEFLRFCQHRIFDLGGELSIPDYQIITAEHVSEIEIQLDLLNEKLLPLDNFILPGGHKLVATIHISRSICRRAERDVIAIGRAESVNPEGIKFLNRLSDYLFVAARFAAKQLGIDEVLWEKG